MSKIALNSNASGTGVFTIASPNSDTDRTLTLPDKTGTVNVGEGIDDNATSTAITIDSSGDVSIGTSTAGVTGLSISSTKNLGWTQSSGESLANMFRQQSSGALVTGYGYQRSSTANGFASSYSSSLSRAAASFSDSIRFYVDTASTVAAGTDITPTERMRIDSSGNVGIGTTNPGSKLVVEAGDDDGIRIDSSDDTFTGRLSFGDVSDNYIGAIEYDHNVDAMWFYVNNAERMRITSDGFLLVGTTSTTVNTANFGTRIGGSNSSTLKSFRNVGGGTTCCAFGGSAGQVQVLGDGDLENTNNSYGSISDERVKSNIVDASSQIDDIMAVQVRSYTLNETGATHIGVVAQELEASGMSGLVKTNDEGMKSVKYSILYMKAIKALQEAVAKIEDLESRLSALETN